VCVGAGSCSRYATGPDGKEVSYKKLLEMPSASYFFLDKKVTKKSRPLEICLSNLSNSGKISFFCGISSPALIGKFQNDRFKK
jgi:hypothetical protein